MANESVHFPVAFSMDEWSALLRVVDDHVESLVDWDDDTRAFYEEIANKLREGPLADAEDLAR